MTTAIQQLFGVPKAFIGMVHLLPTPGYPHHPGMDRFVEFAVSEARAIQGGGGHGICIENDTDQPHTVTISTEQEQAMLSATQAVVEAVEIPVGIGVLLNDWKAALNIAHAAGAAYVRIDVYVDRVSCDAGIIEPEAEKILAYREQIGAQHVAIFADIQVKHKTLLEEGKALTTSAQQAFDANAAAVTVTGTATGKETPLDDVRLVKEAFPDKAVLIGAGVNQENVAEQFAIADGAFVGTSLKTDGAVDPTKVRGMVDVITAL